MFNFVLIDLRNTNTDREQAFVLNNLSPLSKNFDVTLEKISFNKKI